jgi:hypothetical protein
METGVLMSKGAKKSRLCRKWYICWGDDKNIGEKK